jgi:hypothetical protein
MMRKNDGPQNPGLLAIQPLDVAVSVKIFYSTQFIYKISFHFTNGNNILSNLNINKHFTPQYTMSVKTDNFYNAVNFP